MIKIVYGSRDPFVRMVDKERTCLFHWTQSFDKHTKQLIRLELQDEHKVLCHQYKNATSLVDVNSHYVLIHCRWLSSRAAFRQVSMRLTIDLAFGIFVSINGEVSWSM
jgi:hypothetical protein